MRWKSIFDPVVAALKVKYGSFVVESALDLVVAAYKEEADRLNAIDAKLDQLLRSPMNAGLTWLAMANAPERTPDEKFRYVEKALEKFVDAYAQTGGLQQVSSMAHIGLAHGLLGHRADMEDWLKEAITLANDHIEAAWASAAGVGWMEMAFGLRMVARKRLTAAIDQFRPEIDELCGVLSVPPPVTWAHEVVEGKYTGRVYHSQGAGTVHERESDRAYAYRDGVKLYLGMPEYWW